MDIIEFREMCLSLPLAQETTPFGDDVLVYKIEGKMFCYASISDFSWVGVKCDPAAAVDYRERYADISHAPHMSKVHWIGLGLNGELSGGFIRDRIRESYELVVSGLPKARREAVGEAIKGLE